MQVANQAREKGNDLFLKKEYKLCLKYYENALRLYEIEGPKANQLRARTLNNRALCHQKLGFHDLSLNDCNVALNIDPTNSKSLFLRIAAKKNLKDWEGLILDVHEILGGEAKLRSGEIDKVKQLALEAKEAIEKDDNKQTNIEQKLSELSTSNNKEVLSSTKNTKTKINKKQERKVIVNPDLSDGGPNVHKLTFSPPAEAISNTEVDGWLGTQNLVVESCENKVIVESNKQGAKIKGACAACFKEASSICKRCNKSVYCSRSCQASHWKFHKKFCSKGVEDPSPHFSEVTRRGVVGLVNLGNSCYMNSAMACLSHVYPITRHFISGAFQAELNRENDLGSKGDIAENLAALLSQLWFGADKSVAAKSLKAAIDRRTDQFSGFVQHDASEWLSFLLDMVHEDLNRVVDRKYVEIPDPGDRSDDDVSAELWDLHRKRNDSVVVDTVSGVYKSTITCPECSTPWRKFDPFNSIELPLPIRSSRALRVKLIKRNPTYVGAPKQKNRFDSDGNLIEDTMPTIYSMEVTKRTLMGHVIEKVSKLSGVPIDQLNFWESYNGRVYKGLMDPRYEVYRLAAGDVVVASELPDINKFALKDDVQVPVKREEVEEDDNVMRFIVLHRLGGDKGVRGIRGYSLESASLYFSEPLVCFAKKNWTLAYFKRHIVAQITHLLKPPGYQPTKPLEELTSENDLYTNFDDDFLVSLAQGLKVAEITSQNVARTSVNKRMMPLAEAYYSSVDPNLVLSQLFPTAKTSDVLYVALEWNDANFQYMKYGQHYEVPFREHKSVAKYSHLETPMSLDQCFNLYCSDEKMEMGEDFYCKTCKDHVGGCVKSMRLTRAPEVLILTLKRFGQQLRRSGHCFPDKLQDLVEFPLNGFDISPYLLLNDDSEDENLTSSSSSHDSTIYDLFGSVNHYGHATFGHYRAFIRSGEWADPLTPHDKWFQYDDDAVKEVDAANVISNSAYVLFYRRRPANFVSSSTEVV